MVTQQQLFDKIVMHLLTQGKPATILGACYYRTSAGLSCAIGCLIPNNLYRLELENTSIHGVISMLEKPDMYTQEELDEFKAIGITPENAGLLSLLQDTHDAVPPESWFNQLQYIAIDYKLTMPCNKYGVPL